MASNRFKVHSGSRREFSIFAALEEKLRLGSLFREGLPVGYLPRVLFVTMLCLLYIANNHWAERMVRKIDALEVEVEEMRADYISHKAEYMFAGKQSEVSKRVRKLGLTESMTPPVQITVRRREY